MNKRVYKFTSARYGISNLQDRRGSTARGYPNYVLYQPNVLKVNKDDIDLRLVDRLLRTKHESWSYEQEVRMFVNLDDPLMLRDYDGWTLARPWSFREVLIGVQCSPQDSDAVIEAVKPWGDSVKCWWAGMRPDAFLLVRRESAPLWQTQR